MFLKSTLRTYRQKNHCSKSESYFEGDNFFFFQRIHRTAAAQGRLEGHVLLAGGLGRVGQPSLRRCEQNERFRRRN
jgi:hypothetical protein